MFASRRTTSSRPTYLFCSVVSSSHRKNMDLSASSSFEERLLRRLRDAKEVSSPPEFRSNRDCRSDRNRARSSCHRLLVGIAVTMLVQMTPLKYITGTEKGHMARNSVPEIRWRMWHLHPRPVAPLRMPHAGAALQYRLLVRGLGIGLPRDTIENAKGDPLSTVLSVWKTNIEGEKIECSTVTSTFQTMRLPTLEDKVCIKLL